MNKMKCNETFIYIYILNACIIEQLLISKSITVFHHCNKKYITLAYSFPLI